MVKDIPREKYKLRLLSSGAEIKDDKQLFQYKLENDANIQLMKSEL